MSVEQDQPVPLVRVREREVDRDHREDDRKRQVVVVHRALLRPEQRRRVRLPPLLLGADELPVGGNDVEEDVPGHDRPEHRPDLEEGRAAAEELRRYVRGRDGEEGDRHAERELPPGEQAAEEVVDDPRERQQRDARRDRDSGLRCRPPAGRSGTRPPARSRERRRARSPESHVVYASHLNQWSGSGSAPGRDFVLLRVVEAAAVNGPELPGHALVGVVTALRRPERQVEVDEVEGRADPCHRRDDVQPPEEDVQPVGEIGIHRCRDLTVPDRWRGTLGTRGRLRTCSRSRQARFAFAPGSRRSERRQRAPRSARCSRSTARSCRPAGAASPLGCRSATSRPDWGRRTRTRTRRRASSCSTRAASPRRRSSSRTGRRASRARWASWPETTSRRSWTAAPSCEELGRLVVWEGAQTVRFAEA